MNKKKHVAWIIALAMVLSVIPGVVFADTAAAASKLKTPTLTNHAASSTSIKNTWKKVKGAKGYQVYRATKEKGKYKNVKTIKSGKTVSWTDKKLKKNKNYFYKVRAYKTVKGKKQYSKFSKVQWAVPTNEPNWEYGMASKKQTTNKIKLKIYNKSRYNMVFTKEGAFFKDEKAFDALVNNADLGNASDSELAAVGIYMATTTKTTIKPGKSATLTYTTAKKVPYSAKSIISGMFQYHKKDFLMTTGWDFGSYCDEM